MTPKFRAWGVERDPGLKQPASKMHRNVSVVTTYPEGITFILTNFSMWGDDEYSGSIIDDAILMQSTGLKDKNSKEIFEGDIVRQVRTQPITENETITGVVIMIEGAWLIMNDCEQLASYLWSETDENEIIGNVYENTELLEAIKCTQK